MTRQPRWAVGLLVAALFAAALLFGGSLYVWRGAGPLKASMRVVVPEGATLAGTARELQRSGAIRSARAFRGLARVYGSHDPVRAGEYVVPAGASPAAVLDLLQHGRPLLHLVTVPEGTPSVLVVDRLAAARGMVGTTPVLAEGSVLPDSYGYELGETRAALARRMVRAMDRELVTQWAQRASGLAVRTPREALILASIVEKETGVPAERATVAAVYANRLRAAMPLQADPTVIYPVTHGRSLGRRILASELRARNGYNTYAMAGLPEGPICNPGRASIAAVLHPAPSRALYFVADGKGGHVFADTLAQHSANVRNWYAIRHARGEM